MQTAAAAFKSPTSGQSNLFFKCDHCGIPLVVESKSAGMTFKCQRCGQPTAVPPSSPVKDAVPKDELARALSAPVPAERVAELNRHLKENESQRTEINGYINQLSIQLHRWQLRLQTLNERKKELTDEIGGVIVVDNSQRPG